MKNQESLPPSKDHNNLPAAKPKENNKFPNKAFKIAALRKLNLQFLIAWMDSEGIMVCEVSQTKTNSIWYDLYMASKKAKFIGTESRMVVIRSWGLREMGRYWSKETNFYL